MKTMELNNKPLSQEEIEHHINALIVCDALEVIPDPEDPTVCRIPYMMNDAAEYYLTFRGCKITGTLHKKWNEKTTFQIVEAEDRYALMLYHENGDVLVLWYSSCTESGKLYQYHRIAHYWIHGQENWRQLVYMIGTIHDKYTFLGEAAVNEREKALMPLIGFGPLRYWTPVRNLMDGAYQDTDAGSQAIIRLAKEAGDLTYARDVAKFIKNEKNPIRKIFLSSSMKTQASLALSKMLLLPERDPLYELIYQKICQASSSYPERDYGKEDNAAHQAMRDQVSQLLTKKYHFHGTYPHFFRNVDSNVEDSSIEILVTEEHPFTIKNLDYDGFDFCLHLQITIREGKNITRQIVRDPLHQELSL